MHEARSPAVVGVFCLITLAVCFISAWWFLMNELAPRCPVMSGGVVLSWRSHLMPNFSLARLATDSKSKRTLPICLSACQRVRVWRLRRQPFPEFINLHLRDISGTSRQPYALWLLDSFPLLGFSSRRWAVWRSAQMARRYFLHFPQLVPHLRPHGNAELSLSQDVAPVSHRQSIRSARALMKACLRSSHIVLDCSSRSSRWRYYVKHRANLLWVGNAYSRGRYLARDALLWYIIAFIFNPECNT